MRRDPMSETGYMESSLNDKKIPLHVVKIDV
jgi:hypothetical protein